MARGKENARSRRIRERLAENPGMVLEDVLSEDEIHGELMSLGHLWRERVFTPLVTLWTFLQQVLSADGSCARAVADVLSYLSVTVGLHASRDPSAYCQARKRLPVELLPRLARSVAAKLAAQVGPNRLWHGRRVKLVDGSSLSMPDTPQNQAEYPQPTTQKPGCGFPLARIAGVFDMVTGAVVNLAMACLDGVPRKS